MKYVLIGGTGTLGKELTRQILNLAAGKRVVSFSRDEQKQQGLRPVFPAVEYVIGDVRDRDAVRAVMRGADVVFLLAAIKHVDVAERYPLEALKTNVYGAVNVAEAALDLGTPYVVYSNTDKSVLPVTNYGFTKALAQNHLLSLNGQGATRFSAFNWGNILASRGSVIQTFVSSLLETGTVSITDPRMSRFWLRIEDAATFMLEKYRTAPPDGAMIPPVKGATVLRVADMVARCLGIKDYGIKMVGLRCTEKIYEVLQSNHVDCLRSDTCEQYTTDELEEMLAPVVAKIAAEPTRVVG